MKPTVVTKNGRRFVIHTDFALRDAVKRINGRKWDDKRKFWSCPATQGCAGDIYDHLVRDHGAQVDPEVLGYMVSALDARDATVYKDAEDLPEIPARICECGEGPLLEDPDADPPGLCLRCQHPVQSWLHQRQAFHFFKHRDGSGCFMDMGSAKSRVLVALTEEWECNLVVILGPRKALSVWPQEFRRHGVRDWIVCNHGGRKINGRPRRNPSGKQRVEAAKNAIVEGERTDRPVCIAVNYESCWRDPVKKFLLSLEIDLGALDEGHRCKAAGGAWSRFAETLSRRCKKRLDLTGTPRPHSELDLYAQARFIDPGIFGTSYAAHKKRYFDMGGFEDRELQTDNAYQGFLSQEAKDEFIDKFASFSYVCDTDDVLDLPPSIILPPRTAELGPRAYKHYEELETEFVTWVSESPEDEPVSAANALAKMMRLAQVASGHLPVENADGDKRIVTVGTELRELFDDTLDDIPAGEPVVAYARFHHDLDNIQAVAEKRGLRYGEISGRRSDGLGRDEHGEELPTMSPDIDICGTQLQSGGFGIDLTRSAYGVYYNIDFALGSHDQSRRRQDRPGQTRSVRFIYLLIDDTIMVTIFYALIERRDVLKAVIDEVKKRRGYVAAAREGVA